MAPHTSADDPSRYRSPAEADRWRDRDPVTRLETALRERGLLTDEDMEAASAEAEAYAADLRERLSVAPDLSPAALLDHVFGVPPAHLLEQRAALWAELEDC